jgi:hypothetical protein
MNGHPAFDYGQRQDSAAPKAIARAFLTVAPQPHEQFDFFADFAPGTELPPSTETKCGHPSGNCFQQWRYVSKDYDHLWQSVATNEYAIGNVLGQLWVRYADWAADNERQAPAHAGEESQSDE